MTNFDERMSAPRDPKSVAEILRMLPNGAKRMLYEVIDGRDLNTLPTVTLDWLAGRDAIRTSTKSGQVGKLIFTRTGQQALQQLKSRREGKQ